MAVATTADLEAQDTRRLERYMRVTYRSFMLAAFGFLMPGLVGVAVAYDLGRVEAPVALAVVAGLAALTWCYSRLVRTGLAGGASLRDIALSGVLAGALSLMLLINPLFNVIAVFWVSAVALSPMGRRRIIALCLGTAAFCSVLSTIWVQRLFGDEGVPWYAAFAVTFALYAAICGIVVFCNRYQRRIWDMHQETHAARDALARLAVTEERLRFSRDLHDLLGHSLSLIAVKSELALRMTETDPARAGAEMADVRNTAREALREVRAAVSGYREVELDAELAGARAVLEAAGIRCETGDLPDALPPEVRAVLAWVIREGTTNVIKHSQASRCTVSLTSYGDSVALEMRNDGAAGTTTTGTGTAAGSGLTGLAERVAVLGGEVTSGRHGRADFVLRADVPLPGPDPEAGRGEAAGAGKDAGTGTGTAEAAGNGAAVAAGPAGTGVRGA